MTVPHLNPFPFSMFNRGSLSVPLLNQLSAGTTVIGAWSTARRLKIGVSHAFLAIPASGAGTDIGFTSVGLLDTAALISFAAGAAVGLGSNGQLGWWYDQSGNGNNLSADHGFNVSGCQVTTGAGALNAPITVAGGTSMPMVTTGSTGVYGLGSIPGFLSTQQLTSGIMATPFGAVKTWWCFTVVRLKSGSGSTFGRIASFTASGQTTDSTTGGSAFLLAGSNTSGALENFKASGSAVATGTSPVGSPTLLGSVFTATTGQIYVDRATQTSGSNSASLGSTGIYDVGNYYTNGVAANGILAADFAEQICGTVIAAGDLTLIQDNMRAFYETP